MADQQRAKDIMAQLAEGHTGALFDAMAEDITWRVMGVDRWSRTFEGKQAVVNTLFGGAPVTPGPSSRVVVHAIHGDGDAVVVEYSARNELPDGRLYENNYCWVFRFRDGLIREVREYIDTLHATETFSQRSTP